MKKDLLHDSTVCFLSDFIQANFDSILSVVHSSGHADFSKHETRGEKSPVSGRQSEKFYTVMPDFCGSSVWYLSHVTSLRSRILWWLLDFCKICAPLYWKVDDVPEGW